MEALKNFIENTPSNQNYGASIPIHQTDYTGTKLQKLKVQQSKGLNGFFRKSEPEIISGSSNQPFHDPTELLLALIYALVEKSPGFEKTIALIGGFGSVRLFIHYRGDKKACLGGGQLGKPIHVIIFNRQGPSEPAGVFFEMFVVQDGLAEKSPQQVAGPAHISVFFLSLFHDFPNEPGQAVMGLITQHDLF
jgi:hypothetical protein